MVVQTTAMVPQICGTMIFQKICQPLAPSMTAASMVSSGMPRRAADRMTMAKPVWIQMRITIRKKLFQKGMEIQTSGLPPKNSTTALRRPICTWPSARYS